MTASVLMERLKADSIINDDLEVDGNIFELQSMTKRPRHDGPYIVFNWQESTLYSQTYTGMQNGIDKAPRVLQVWAHFPEDISTDYDDVNRILNRVDVIFAGLIHETGEDNQRVTMVRKAGRSANLKDEANKTITRHAVYGVLYDEMAA